MQPTDVAQVPQAAIIGAYFTGAALVITAIGNLIVNIINTRKLTQIHTVTNSGLTETKNELKGANANIVRLSQEVTALQGQAAIAAQIKDAVKDAVKGAAGVE